MSARPLHPAAIAIDPRFGYAFTEASIRATAIPVLLINLGKEGRDRWLAVDSGPKGSNLAGRLPKSDYVELSPAHHFTFLSLCKEGAAKALKDEGSDPICDDPKGTDHARIHKRIIEAIADFLKL